MVDDILNAVQSHLCLLVNDARKLFGVVGCLSNLATDATFTQISYLVLDNLQVLILCLLKLRVMLVVEAVSAVCSVINLHIETHQTRLDWQFRRICRLQYICQMLSILCKDRTFESAT